MRVETPTADFTAGPAMAEAVALHRDHGGDPLEVPRRLGGREVAAVVGANRA